MATAVRTRGDTRNFATYLQPAVRIVTTGKLGHVVGLVACAEHAQTIALQAREDMYANDNVMTCQYNSCVGASQRLFATDCASLPLPHKRGSAAARDGRSPGSCSSYKGSSHCSIGLAHVGRACNIASVYLLAGAE
jgi:hypothetical protein